MWKLPFYVLGKEAYSDLVFSNSEECLTKFGTVIEAAMKEVAKKRMTVEKLLIFKNQVIALPPSYYDQRLLGIADMPGAAFDSNIALRD